MPTTRGQKKDAEMEAALKTFFSSPRFAVAGASSDPTKFGHKGQIENLNIKNVQTYSTDLKFSHGISTIHSP